MRIRNTLRCALIGGLLATTGSLASGVVLPAPVSAQTNPNTAVICGPNASYGAPSATATGTISVGLGGPTFTIAAGATFTGLAIGSVTNICLVATLNGQGQIISAVVFPNPTPVSTASLTVCGFVTAVGTGSVAIAGQSFNFATGGATFTGGTLSQQGPICLALQLNSSGQIQSGVISTALGTAATPFTVCGPVTVFTAASTSAAGTLTINGGSFAIATGTSFTGTPIAVGSSFCVNFTLDANGQIVTATGSVPLAAAVVYGWESHHHGIGGPIPFE